MQLIDAALDLYLGGQCHGCGAPGRSPCLACRAELAPRPAAQSRPGLDVPLVSAVGYDQAMPFIIAYKDREAWQLTAPLGRALVGSIRYLVGSGAPVTLVPVPSSPSAVRSRGFDHTATLASWAAKQMGCRWAPLLARTGKVVDQVGQGTDGRMRNQAGSMTARPGNRCVVVVDDIVTSGATAIEAVRALVDAGHTVFGVATIADTPLGHVRPSGRVGLGTTSR